MFSVDYTKDYSLKISAVLTQISRFSRHWHETCSLAHINNDMIWLTWVKTLVTPTLIEVNCTRYLGQDVFLN